jgi:hypothetical protein
MTDNKTDFENIISQGMDDTLRQTQEVFIRRSKEQPHIPSRLKRFTLVTVFLLLVLNGLFYLWAHNRGGDVLSVEEADRQLIEKFGEIPG